MGRHISEARLREIRSQLARAPGLATAGSGTLRILLDELDFAREALTDIARTLEAKVGDSDPIDGSTPEDWKDGDPLLWALWRANVANQGLLPDEQLAPYGRCDRCETPLKNRPAQHRGDTGYLYCPNDQCVDKGTSHAVDP